MTQLWVRHEDRPNEARVGLMPGGVATLREAGITVTVEESSTRIIPIDAYRAAGARIAPQGSWRSASRDTIIFGLKELPEDGTPLIHRHIMFGHAYKGQPAGRVLLDRFRAGGGALYDLEYLVDAGGRRVAAFGYWAGYAGAAVTALAWLAQQSGDLCPAVDSFADAAALRDTIAGPLSTLATAPRALIIGALGRVGTGASDFCAAVGIPTTRWDMAETAHGGPFPEVLAHEIFLNCILATPGVPVFVPESSLGTPRALTAIGDIACDPTSAFSPIKVYDRTTSWAEPVLRVAEAPPLDVMAIDNLPSLLPKESSEDFAQQLLPYLAALPEIGADVWGRAKTMFDQHVGQTE